MFNFSKKILYVVIVTFVVVIPMVALIHFKSIANKPNIIFIVVDALRSDHLSSYGYERDTSSNIDKLANEGVVFLNCFATSSSTGYSSVGLMTGKYLMIFGNDEAAGILDKKFPTLAEYLKKLGYFNVTFLNNGHYDYTTGFERGIDNYKNYTGNAKDTTDMAIKFLQNYHRKRPFFLWVHYIDPHAPYSAPEEYFRIFERDNLWEKNDKNLQVHPEAEVDPDRNDGFIPKIVFHEGNYLACYYIARYDAEIRYTDFHIGRLVREMPKNTLVILTADHGESMGEHNVYFSHGENIYDELLHVPLIIRDSGYFAGGKRIPAAVSSVDIVPTILSRIDPLWFFLKRNKFNGIDLKRAAKGKDLKRKYIFSYNPDVYCIRDCDKKSKYILDDKGKEELYFLPDEDNNFIEDNSFESTLIRKKLRVNLKIWLADYPLRSDINPRNIPPSKEVQENLRSLGYLQ